MDINAGRKREMYDITGHAHRGKCSHNEDIVTNATSDTMNTAHLQAEAALLLSRCPLSRIKNTTAVKMTPATQRLSSVLII